MSYNKIFNKGKKFSRRRKAKTVNGRQNQRIKKLEAMVYPAIETKAKDINTAAAAISTTAYANYPLFQLIQGHGHSERIGDKVTLKNMMCNLTLKKGDSSNVVRVIIAATPSTSHLVLSDVLTYNNMTTHGDSVFSSPYKRRATTSEKTYSILFDKVYNVTEDIDLVVDKFYCKLPKNGKVCTFNAIGQQAPDNFNVLLLAISDSAASGHPTLSLNVRSKYIDL